MHQPAVGFTLAIKLLALTGSDDFVILGNLGNYAAGAIVAVEGKRDLVVDSRKVGHVDLHRFRIKHYPVLMGVDYFPNPKRVNPPIYKKKKKDGET